MRVSTGLLLFVAGLAVASAYPSWFETQIPNIPVVNGAPWPGGGGHTVAKGGGARNVFGKAFKAAGYKWTPALCKMDSDGDGLTNGQELGDPDCKWVAGQPKPAPCNGFISSHPGIASSVPQQC